MFEQSFKIAPAKHQAKNPSECRCWVARRSHARPLALGVLEGAFFLEKELLLSYPQSLAPYAGLEQLWGNREKAK